MKAREKEQREGIRAAVGPGSGIRKALSEEGYRAFRMAAVSLEKTVDFPATMANLITRLEEEGLALYSLSVFLLEARYSPAIHYFLLPIPVGWREATLAVDAPEFRAYAEKQSSSWEDSVDGSRWHWAVPVSLGTVVFANSRSGDFSPVEKGRLEQVAPELEMLAIRHRDLQTLEELKVRALQTNADLVALHDGSYDLSGQTRDEVAQKTVRMVVERLGFDRAGIFLRDAGSQVLRGAWGVDDDGRLVPIDSTVFPLYPERDEEIAEAARIARGELAYFLTRNLDGEGGKSVEGNIEANLSVPMRVGERIVGVLAVDNYFKRQPIVEEQIQPLMILANQAGAALENAGLYETLHRAYDELEARVEARTAELARINVMLQGEISERQQVEAQLKASLEEKEMLVKEIHHRVKNNLTVISSMLSLQAMELPDERARRAFQDSQSRVQSVALIHEKLYLSRELGRIQLAEYIPDLVRDVFDSNQSDESRVALKVQVEKVDLGVDAAINCGLIVNELVSNALKHAFPAGQEGEVGVVMRKIGEEQLCLQVWNTGKGLPEDLELSRRKSLGLKLVDALVGMLKGGLQIRRGERTEFSVTFPYEAPVSGR